MDVIGHSRWCRRGHLLLILAVALFLACGCSKVSVTPGDLVILPIARSGTLHEQGYQWPGWRGAAAQGVSSEVNLPVRWTSSESIRWRAYVPGEGNSSPVVWDEQIFLTSLIGGRDDRLLALLCFDRRTGSLLWQRTFGPPTGRTHSKNGHASASVATDGKQVYAFFGARGLVCFDMDGQQRWDVRLGNMDHEWGTASSPVLYRNLVIQLCDYEGPSFLVGLNKQTGNVVWRAPRDSHGCWSTPVLVRTGTGTDLVVNGTGSTDGGQGDVIGYDPSTGAERWRVAGTTDIPCPTAIIGDGIVISSSGDNGPVFAIQPGGVDTANPARVLWRHPRGGPNVATGLIDNGRLFLVSQRGVLSCYKLLSGEQLWRRRLKGDFCASLVAGAGHIYAVSEQGDVHVFTSGDSFQLLATNRMNQRCLATPAIAHGEFYLRTETHLICVAATDPTVAHQATVAADPATVAVADDSIPSRNEPAVGTGTQ